VDPIVEVRARTIRLPLPRPLQLGPMQIAHRAYAVVTLRTASGFVGNAFSLSRDAPVAAVVNEQLAPLLVDRDAELVTARWQECFDATISVGRVGVVMRALSLVDIALWDVKAQRAGLPLWRLLGGADARVPTLMVAGYPTGEPPEELGERVGEYGREGWRLLKLARTPDSAAMRRLIQASTSALPDGCELVVDCAWVWRRPVEAMRELAAWGSPPLAWLEDPLPPEDVGAYVRLGAAAHVPLAVGDELTDWHLLRTHLAAGTLGVVRLDATTIGGVTRALRVLHGAADAGLPVSCHVYPELHVHLAAAFGSGVSAETFDRAGNPFDPAHTLYGGGPELACGFATAPDTPGLGFVLDEELVETHLVD
jgi:L-alanine-DL-glutamate epimerase-like enolase superfamily enzyme